MDQLTLLEFDEDTQRVEFPLAHRNDPVTSRIAAHVAVSSGLLSAQLERVYQALCEFPLSTSDELAEKSGIPHPTCARRLPDLMRMGLVVQEARRASTISRRQAMTWRPVGGGATRDSSADE